MKKEFRMWVLQNPKGEIWRYTSGPPVIYRTKREASVMAKRLHKATKWRPVRASLTVLPVSSFPKV